MRAPLRGGSRAGLRRAEPVSAGATDALENALRAVTIPRSGLHKESAAEATHEEHGFVHESRSGVVFEDVNCRWIG